MRLVLFLFFSLRSCLCHADQSHDEKRCQFLWVNRIVLSSLCNATLFNAKLSVGAKFYFLLGIVSSSFIQLLSLCRFSRFITYKNTVVFVKLWKTWDGESCLWFRQYNHFLYVIILRPNAIMNGTHMILKNVFWFNLSFVRLQCGYLED